jgi:hypothetical protein
MRKDLWAPLTGVLFIVVLIISFLVSGGDPPDADEGAGKVIKHYVDHKDAIEIGAAISAVAAALLVFFGSFMHSTLDAPAPGRSIAPRVAFAGTVMIAIGAMIDGTISFALAEAVDNKVPPQSLLGLQALWDNDFLPLLLGGALFLLASGIAIVQHGALPVWLGWVAIVLGVVAFTPVGFVALLAGAVWIVVASVMLTLRASRATPLPPAAPATEPQAVGVTR